MKVPVLIIKRFAYDDSTDKYSTESIEIINKGNFTCQYGFQDKKDTFSLDLLPTKKYFSHLNKDIYHIPPVENNDILEFYVYYEDDTNIVYDIDGVTVSNLEDFLLFVGVVDNYAFDSSSGIMSLNVTGNNRTEILLNNLTFFQYTNITVANMITENGNKLRLLNKNRPLFIFKDYKGDGTDLVGSMPQAYNSINENLYNDYIPGYEQWGIVPRGGVRAYKKAAYEKVIITEGGKQKEIFKLKSAIDLNAVDIDGNLIYRFPPADYYETYKPLYSHLDIISSTSYTGDKIAGPYITYVGNDNVMRWEPRVTTTTDTVLESQTTTTAISREIREIVNAVIINVGQDVRQKGILALAYDTTSMSKFGAKWKYITRPNISEQMQKEQKENSGVEYNDNNNFPVNYPVSITIPKQSAIFDKETSEPIWKYELGDELADDSEFNKYVRLVSRENGRDYARDFIKNNKNAKYFGKMTLELGTTQYNIGEFLDVEIISLNWMIATNTHIRLRISEVIHNINENGWETSLNLEQDAEEYVA